MGIGFSVLAPGPGDLFFARKREQKFGCFFRVFGGVFAFLVVISPHFLGVISRFGGCFRATRPFFRAQREKKCGISPPRGREQNVKFSLCR